MSPTAAQLNSDTTRTSAGVRAQAALEVLLIWAVFAIHAGWPIPDVNESHYLVKARHFWDPDWIPNDFFLAQPAEQSLWTESHLAFYLATGWISRLVSLYWYAVIGRAAIWLSLAYAFRRVSVAVVPARWLSVLAAALFVAMSENCQLAGEWVVGGVEAKSVAYVFVFLALADMATGRWLRSMIWAGVATLFHVLVGGWAAGAILIVWMIDPAKPRPVSLLRAVFVFGCIAAPGVVPVLAMDWGVDPAVIAEARQLYVFQRLPHHLLPPLFSLEGATRYLGLFLLWLLFAWSIAPSEAQRRLRWFTLLAMTIAAFGILLSWATWHRADLAATWMRYYWFRLADFALPLGAALAWVAWAAGGRKQFASRQLSSRKRYWRLAAPIVVAGIYLVTHGRQVLTADQARSEVASKVESATDWRAATEWVKANTPRDAVFLTPKTAQTFKWRAGRGEVVNWKDLPQDASGIVEWWRRMVDIYGREEYAVNSWEYGSLAELAPARLRELGRKYGAAYLLTESDPPLDLPRLYANTTYTVYALDEPRPARGE